MPEKEPRIRDSEDGTVEIWYRGWRFAFRGEAEPEVRRDAVAAQGTKAAGCRVKLGWQRMRYGQWIAVFDPTGRRRPKLLRASPLSILSPVIQLAKYARWGR